MMMIKNGLMLVAILATSGCETVRYVSAPLPLPEQPALPRLSDAELECLPPAVYRKVAGRDLAHRHYERRLKAVILSTHHRTLRND